MSGLTPTGFTPKTQQEIVASINTGLLANVDAKLDTSPDQPIGQIVGIVAEKIAEKWEAVSSIYSAIDPDEADDIMLDNVCSLTGTRRRSATYSLVTATVDLNATTTISAGATASVAGQPQNIWILLADVTSTTAGTYTAFFRSAQPGPFVANAHTLTVIAAPVSGWNSITNAADATQGIVQDTDATLRVRRLEELAAAGASTIDAIRADVLQVTGVQQAYVLENDTDAVDVNGLPAHSFAVIVWDGTGFDADDDEIAQAIWNGKPAGIRTYGGSSGTAVDSTGTDRVVNFSRATQVTLYSTLTVVRGPNAAAGIDTTVKAAMAAFALATYLPGVTVFALKLEASALIPGVNDVTNFRIGAVPSPPGNTNIAVSQFQIATLSTTNISVTLA